MSFLKLRFLQNKCRICLQVLCCSPCRKKHEQNVHNVFPECDICIYGKIFLKNPSEELLDHIKLIHWPLHCVYCRRLFGSINELKEHNKCPVGAPQQSMEVAAAKTPIRTCLKYVENCEDLKSPPVGIINNNKHFQFTSTPMPKNDDKIMLNMFPNTITPVDNYDNSTKLKYANENLSTHTPILNDEKKNDKIPVYKKQRVTFSETPNTENSKNINDESLKTSLETCQPQKLYLDEDVSINVIQDLYLRKCVNKSDDVNYKSADCIAIENCNEIQQNDKNDKTNRKNKRISNTFNETLWQSAITNLDETNDSFAERNEEVGKIVYSENEDLYVKKNDCTEYSDSLCINNQECSSFDFNAFSDISNTSKKSVGVWSSVANYVKSAVQVFSSTPKIVEIEEINYSLCNKRSFSEMEYASDVQLQALKRIKLTDIRCRPTIRKLKSLSLFKRHAIKVDKSTQTD